VACCCAIGSRPTERETGRRETRRDGVEGLMIDIVVRLETTDGQPELRVEQMETRGSEASCLERLDRASGQGCTRVANLVQREPKLVVFAPIQQFCWAKETRLWLSTCCPLRGPIRDMATEVLSRRRSKATCRRSACSDSRSICHFKQPSSFSSGGLSARSAEGTTTTGTWESETPNRVQVLCRSCDYFCTSDCTTKPLYRIVPSSRHHDLS
jgi:hypothetical protein